jgi:hypothetical protein
VERAPSDLSKRRLKRLFKIEVGAFPEAVGIVVAAIYED